MQLVQAINSGIRALRAGRSASRQCYASACCRRLGDNICEPLRCVPALWLSAPAVAFPLLASTAAITSCRRCSMDNSSLFWTSLAIGAVCQVPSIG